MSPQERGLVLKFVTSCERPPSLGFAALDPKFTIQRIDTNGNRVIYTYMYVLYFPYESI